MVVIDVKTAKKQQVIFKLNDMELQTIKSSNDIVNATYEFAIKTYNTMSDKPFTCLFARLVGSDLLSATFQSRLD